MPDKMTVQEVAQRLGIKDLAVYRRVYNGTLIAKKQPGGKRLYFDKEYIDKLAS